jgi:hypothetical protein
MKQQKKIVFLTSGLVMLALLLVAAPSLAATLKKSPISHGVAGKIGNFKSFMSQGKKATPAATGKITAVSGSILTIAGVNKTTYTVDATNAKINTGFGADAKTIAVSNLTVGEMISAVGTVSGTNVAATAISIFDNAGRGEVVQPGDAVRTPRVMGKVSAVDGSSFTVQTNGRMRGPQSTSTTATVFTVNTTATTVFTKDGAIATLADVVSGAEVSVSGTINATAKTVSATSVNVMTKQPAAPQWGKAHATPTTVNKTSFVGKIMNFFKSKVK